MHKTGWAILKLFIYQALRKHVKIGQIIYHLNVKIDSDTQHFIIYIIDKMYHNSLIQWIELGFLNSAQWYVQHT